MEKTLEAKELKPIDREAVRVLALEVGAREAARALKLNENTVLAWASRDNWNLPARNGLKQMHEARVIKSAINVPERLVEHHKELEARGKKALADVGVRSAEAIAGNLPVNSARDLNDLANALAKVFGWSQAQSKITVNADKAVIVCDEGRRNELIEQRQRLLGNECEAE